MIEYAPELSKLMFSNRKMIVTFKSCIQLRVKTSISLASKAFLSIVDHLQTTFSPDLPVKCIDNHDSGYLGMAVQLYV